MRWRWRLTFGAVTAAVVVLAALGYVSLRQWEASAGLLFREQARDMAAMAAEKVEMTVLKSEEECLSGLQLTLTERGASATLLRAWLDKTPLVERVYLVDRHGRVLFPPGPDARDAAVVAGVLAEIPEGIWTRGGRRHVQAGERVVLAALLQGPGGQPVLAALVRNDEALTREVLAKTLGPLEGKSFLAVVDQQGRPVYAAGPVDRAQPVLSVAFGAALPTWRVALYQPEGRNPRDAVRRQAMIFTGALGLLLMVIVLGLGATYRVVRRESEMARLKADFVANVSHDLKTPLSLIRMFAETLELKRVPDEASRQEYYGIITREAERLTRLINNVLDFSRIEGGRQRYDIRPTPVEPVVQETVEAFRHTLTQAGFTVEVDVAPDLPEVPMDGEAIGQALANLIDNAVKYSGETRWLRVAARAAGGELRLEVADRGIGIAPAEQGRVFDKFYRVGRSETQGRRGSGLGLTLVKHIVEAHGGRVGLESEPARGSRFTLALPLGG
jgi:signal transduction histidine kinase